MQLSIICTIIAPQRAERGPECDQMQVIELKPFTSLESLLHSKVHSNGFPGWMRCWQCAGRAGV